MSDKVKGIVVTPIEAIIEPFAQQLSRMVGREHEEAIKLVILEASKRVARYLAIDASRAATKGINQAVDVALDPAYYEHRKDRIRKRKEYRRNQAKIESSIIHAGSRRLN